MTSLTVCLPVGARQLHPSIWSWTNFASGTETKCPVVSGTEASYQNHKKKKQMMVELASAL